jgi:hypothetical protein
MGLFTPRGLESPDDVHRDYAERIERLLDEFEPRDSFWHRPRGFKDLTRWSRTTWDSKQRLESQVRDMNRNLQAANGEVQQLRSNVAETAKALAKEKDLRAQRDEELQSANDRWMAVLDDTHTEHAKVLQTKVEELRTATQTHAQERRDLQEHFNNQMAMITSQYDGEINRMDKDHTGQVHGLKDRITQLTEDIMVNQADSRAWTDEKIKARFQELRRAVEAITSPHTLVVNERSSGVRPRIDPAGFLHRQGDDNYHFLLRNVIWDILYGQFFSEPLGFGALGPGVGYESLLRIYTSWRVLFDRTGDSGKQLSRSWQVL